MSLGMSVEWLAGFYEGEGYARYGVGGFALSISQKKEHPEEVTRIAERV